MFSSTILPPKTTVYFSVALEDFETSKQIYLELTFKNENPDDKNSNDYGNEQKFFFKETDLPK